MEIIGHWDDFIVASKRLSNENSLKTTIVIQPDAARLRDEKKVDIKRENSVTVPRSRNRGTMLAVPIKSRFIAASRTH